MYAKQVIKFNALVLVALPSKMDSVTCLLDMSERLMLHVVAYAQTCFTQPWSRKQGEHHERHHAVSTRHHPSRVYCSRDMP